MTKDNINKPNPKHYKFELRNVPVIIDGEEKIVDSLQFETRYILKDLLNDANLTHEQAFWYGNIGKRYFRLCKKHDDPTADIKKIIQEAVFLISSLLGKEYKAHLLDADGNDLLHDKEEIASIGRLYSLLGSRDQRIVNRNRNIKLINENGIYNIVEVIAYLAKKGKNPLENENFRELIEKQELSTNDIKEIIDILGDLVYGEN